MVPIRTLLASLVSLVVLGTLATNTVAQGTDSSSTTAQVTAVDATESVVEVALIGIPDSAAPSPNGVALNIDNAEVDVGSVSSSRAEQRPTELIVLVDTNVRAVPGDVLSLIKQELAAAVAELPPDTSIAVVSAGESALVTSNPTVDRAKTSDALESLSPSNGSSLYNAIDRAGTLFSSDPTTIKSLLLVATGSDQGSDITLEQAQVSIVQKGVQLVTVSYEGGDPTLSGTVSRTSGAALSIATSGDVTETVSEAVAIASDRLLVSFDEPADTGSRARVMLELNSTVIDFSYPTGVLTSNPLQLEPLPEETSGGSLAFFGSSVGLYLALGLAFVGISLGVWSVGSIMAGSDASLEGMLARYTDGSVEQGEGEVEELIVQSALLQRAVTFSETFAEKRGFLARVEDLLERANMPVRAGEAMFILAAITVLSGLFGVVVTRSILAAGLLAVFATGMSFFVVRLLGRRRFKAFESQLPDTLQLLSGTLRAGYSLPQGLEAVSNEVADPMGGELRRAMTEARLGRDLEESLTGVAERLSSADFAWAVMAIGIQREVGGNLNELLMSVADTMIARERLKREIGALTAEGRMSAGVLSFLPPGLGVVMWIMNPEYVGLLFSEVMGNIMLGMGVVSALVGLAWMKKVITVDV
ncbi:MAG: hypothetical protein GY939_13590 [Actinomycetia bacterium]|nr:hypothetical protein [Actinomycetes bacterium]